MSARLHRLVDKPQWPIAQLATFELRDYADQLRAALQADLRPGDREEAEGLLTEVTGEQASRRRAYKRAATWHEAS